MFIFKKAENLTRRIYRAKKHVEKAENVEKETVKVAEVKVEEPKIRAKKSVSVEKNEE